MLNDMLVGVTRLRRRKISWEECGTKLNSVHLTFIEQLLWAKIWGSNTNKISSLSYREEKERE